MALVAYDRDVIFCATPGTGSTSVSDFLIDHLNAVWVPEQSLLTPSGEYVDYKHSGLSTLLRHDLLDAAFVERAWSFALVRNPFHWYLAEYLRNKNWSYLLSNPTSWAAKNPAAKIRIEAACSTDFHAFISLVMDQVRPPGAKKFWDLFSEQTALCKKVYRYEDMVDVEADLVDRLELPGEQFPYVNKTGISTRVDASLHMFTESVINLISKSNAPSFELYGYSKNFDDAINLELKHRINEILPKDFSPLEYLVLHPDVRNAGIDPARHYLKFGQFEGRKYRVN